MRQAPLLRSSSPAHWVQNRRRAYQKDKLSSDWVAALEAIDGWVWDQYESDYRQALAALWNFVDREGHPRVSARHVERYADEDVKLGTWVSRQRHAYRKHKLSANRIASL